MQARREWKKLLAVFLIISLIACWSTRPAAAEQPSPETQWETNYGEGITLTEVQETLGNTYTVMGTTYEGKFYAARNDSEGNLMGSQSIELLAPSKSGVDKPVNISSVRYTRDGGYFIGGTVDGINFRYNDFVLAKTDNKGEIQWKETFDSGAYGYLNSVRETSDGGSVAALFTVSLNVGFFHTEIQKRDAAGQLEWTTPLGGGGPASSLIEAKSVEQTSDGGYIVGGFKNQNFTVWKMNAAGSVEWNVSYAITSGSVTQTTDGGFAIAGTDASNEAVLLKTDAAGGQQWSKVLTGGQVRSLTPTPDGGYLLAQAQQALKTDASGTIQWSKPATNLIKAIPAQNGGILLLSLPDTLMRIGPGSTPAPQNELKLDSEEYSLMVGQTLDTVLTTVYGDRSIPVTRYGSYSIADPTVAAVDASGNLTGLRSGQTVLTATYSGMQTHASVYVYGVKRTIN